VVERLAQPAPQLGMTRQSLVNMWLAERLGKS
jgi:hypothetical protein